ncbi:PHP domain-containing protein [Paenibacillus sp. 1P07SE]|uniref:PHP domain-containing protein n=1 Tax=Paenibacillus sp. 1P07SE TaxID=3132209 RepID=UPI0039A43B70
MAMTRADLHVHTNASDGLLSPASVVRRAQRAGLAAIAITDHDTMAGVREALQEGKRSGILVIPGVEISTSWDGKDIHVLGYAPDWQEERWQERLRGLRAGRMQRNERIVAKLAELGVQITMAEVLAAAGKSGLDETVGRPHIAAVLLEKGVVASMREAFDRYLADGAAAYVAVPKVTPFTAVEWIKEAGGISSLAHPGLYREDRLIRPLVEAGLDGIEVSHPDHSPEQEAQYRTLAEEYGLIATGGSDFHGERQGSVFHGELGCCTAGLETVAQLQRARRQEL